MREQNVMEHPELSSRIDVRGTAPLETPQVHETDLVQIFSLLIREKRVIWGFSLVLMAITAVIVFGVMRPMYTGEAAFLPPQAPPGSNMSQLAAQLSPMGAMSALSSLKSPGDVYLGILGSRTVADSVIKRFDLQNVYGTKRYSDTVKKLAARSSFNSGKNTLITISVEDHDPKRAADMANAYMDVLREQNGRLALTDASQRRLFFEQQLEHEKNALEDAEVDLKKTEEKTGLIAPLGQAQVEIETAAQMRAEIASRQVELAAMKQGATDQNPAVIRLETQIADLQRQLERIENDKGRSHPGNLQPPAAKVPELALDYVRKQREVKYHETLFELIARQYENARLDESREAPVLQVIDNAVVPDRKSGPPRLLAVLASCVIGLIMGACWVLIQAYLLPTWRK